MSTVFEALDPEAREDWREGPVTQALINRLEKGRAKVLEAIATKAVSGATDPTAYARDGGALQVWDEVIALVEK